MAIGMLLSIIVEDHIPTQEVVDIWLQVSWKSYRFKMISTVNSFNVLMCDNSIVSLSCDKML